MSDQGERWRRIVSPLNLLIGAGIVAAGVAIWLLPPLLVQSDAATIATNALEPEQSAGPQPEVSDPAASVPATSGQATSSATPQGVGSASPDPATSEPPADGVAGSRNPVDQLTTASASALGSARQAVLFGVGGLIAVITLVLSFARHRREEAAAALAVDSNKTDRYSQAVEQLGAKAIPIQLGGIYALERLARDSESDRQTIVDVLAAFLRTRSPASETNSPVSTVVAAAAAVIGSMQSLGLPLNIDLTRVNLTRARLERASFAGAILNGAVLDHARLEHACFDDAEINNASFAGSYIVHASFRGAFGNNSTFKGTRARHVDLTRASLRRARVTGVELQDAILDGTDFHGARLHGTEFARASLSGTDFDSANINLADFTGADVSSALLQATNTAGAIGLDNESLGRTP